MSTKSPITDPAELLHRQVPGEIGYVDEGKPTSKAFKPLDKDNGGLSVDRDAVYSAQKSYEAFVGAGFKSDGVWSVSVQECTDLTLPSFHTAKPENPAHSTVAFSAYETDKKRRKQAGKLAERAIARGCQWKPQPKAVAPNEVPATPAAQSEEQAPMPQMVLAQQHAEPEQAN